MQGKHLFFLLLLCCGSFSLFAQSRLVFQQDSMRVGELVPLYMEIEHSPNEVVVFPDTAEDFGIFEVVTSNAQLTQTVSERSVDAITYYVRTFDLRDWSTLALPYKLVLRGDSSKLSLLSDTIYLSRQVGSIKPPPPFKAASNLVPMQDPPDYAMMFLLIMGTVVTLGLGAWFLRKPVKKYFRLRRLNMQWQSSLRSLNKLQPEHPGAFLDGLNQIWKDYIDLEAGLSLRSLTTTELSKTLPNLPELEGEEANQLHQFSQVGDRVIYAGELTTEKACEELKTQLISILHRIFLRRKAKIG